ncbi:MAG: penicillin acylase family protein, partial [Prolixibacteraceae bacterium]|nr:penicillin acylase family protein [Prolixibacteraceae bacterium]
SFKDAVAELTTGLGENTNDWQWSKIHTFTLSHPIGSVEILNKVLKLNKGPFEMPGSFHTVCPYSYPWGNLYNVNHGASHRHIFDVSNWDASVTVIPTGESGIPASDFYCDQTKLYINNQYHDDLFSTEKVKAAAVFEMKIQPEN